MRNSDSGQWELYPAAVAPVDRHTSQLTPSALAQLLLENPVLTGTSASSQSGWWALVLVGHGDGTWLYARGFAGDYQSHVPEPQDDLAYSWGQPGLENV